MSANNEQMIDAFENQFCARWSDPAARAEQRVWALAWDAASAAMAEPCDMGALCIGCTPRVDGVCPDAVRQCEPVAQVETAGPQGGCIGWLYGLRASVGAKLYAAPQPAPVAQPDRTPLPESTCWRIISETLTFMDAIRATERAHKIGATK